VSEFLTATKVAAYMPMSAELRAEQRAWSVAITQMEADIAHQMHEWSEDMKHGPRLRPGRREYSTIMEPVWRRERLVAGLRRELEAVPMRRGTYVRARHAPD
jgi:hypothetical protein